MIEVDVKLKDFDKVLYPDLAVDNKTLKTDSLALIHSAIMVGRSSYADVMRYGISSAFDLLFRVALLRANLAVSDKKLVKTQVYENLDPTEKSSVSFFLGMMIADLIARKYLGVTRLVHLGHFKKKHHVILSGKKHPDLIGETSGGWVVVEAKGRTGGFDSQAQIKAKAQSRSIVSINGKPPLVHTACQMYFSSKGISVRFDDPEPDEDGDEVDFNYDDFLTYYYAAFLESENLIEVAYLGQLFMVETLSELGVTVGINKGLLGFLQGRDKDYEAQDESQYESQYEVEQILDKSKKYFERVSEIDSDTVKQAGEGHRSKVFDDGVFIELSREFWMKNGNGVFE